MVLSPSAARNVSWWLFETMRQLLSVAAMLLLRELGPALSGRIAVIDPCPLAEGQGGADAGRAHCYVLVCLRLDRDILPVTRLRREVVAEYIRMRQLRIEQCQ